MQRIFLIVILMFLVAQSLCAARPNTFDDVMSLVFQGNAKVSKGIVFNGLKFSVDADTTICTNYSAEKMSCQIELSNGDGPLRAELIFEKIFLPEKSSARLIPLNRKSRWFKEFSPIDQYVETSIVIAGVTTRLQKFSYFRLDNINSPVLLRAFDVVVNERTSISVSTICGVREWPAIQETIDSIERSITKAAR